MKILHIVPAKPYGGAQRSVAQLAGQQCRKGIDARVLMLYYNNTFAEFIEHNGVPYYTTRAHVAWDVRGWVRLSSLIKKISPDIIHMHLALFWSSLLLSLPFIKKCPMVYHARNFSPTKLTLKNLMIRRLLCSMIDALIGNSKAVTGDMKKYLKSDILIYRTIYNGIYLPDATVAKKDRSGRTNNHANGRPLIGMATRLAHDKGIKEFIDAIPSISHLLPSARFVLAGEGPLLSWAQGYSASLGLGDTLKFQGLITQTPPFWSSLDFALFTARHEAFGLRVIEPQATGTVVVGYQSGGGPDEIIISGKTGVLVPWGDRDKLAREISALWGDPPRYDRMAQAARQRLTNHFSIEKTAQECIELYQELLAPVSLG